MKITKQDLVQLIKEELDTTLSEIASFGDVGRALTRALGGGPGRSPETGTRAGETAVNAPAIGAPPSEDIEDWESEEFILDNPDAASTLYRQRRVPTAGGQGYIDLDAKQSELAPGERAQEDIAQAASQAAPETGMSYPSRAAQRMDQARLADLRQQDQLADATRAAAIVQAASGIRTPYERFVDNLPRLGAPLEETITKAVKEALTKKKV